MTDLIALGIEAEENANNLLAEIFDEVKWISKVNPASPYDFICIKDNKRIVVDVKSCLHKRIFITKKKYDKLEKKEFGEFYFLLRVDKTLFNFIHWEELKESKDYTIIITSRKPCFYRQQGNKNKNVIVDVDGTKWNMFGEKCHSNGVTIKYQFNQLIKAYLET